MYNEMWSTGGWGSIEWGSPEPGQVTGGRWKPLHYQFRKSTFADQLSTCNTGGACFVKNDSPFAFSGIVSIRLINVMTAAHTVVKAVPVALAPGAGITQWFCGTSTGVRPSPPARPTPAGGTYSVHQGQIPTDRDNYTTTLQPATESSCEEACNAKPGCLGFTADHTPVNVCWLYSSAPTLMNFLGADWYQKPGTAPIPAPPPPPAPPASKVPPPMLPCTLWNASTAWGAVGCDADGANCVLEIVTNSSGGATVSTNLLPFQPPVAMRLPNATVSAIVDAKVPTDDEVSITLSTTASAMHVVLTTTVDGRFSDNFFLLEPGAPRTISFISWGPVTQPVLQNLTSSLRIEHLADNL
jgi:hypothetical protein